MDAGETIFIVDDDQAIRQSLVVLLERKGYHTREFSSAEDFLSAFEAAPGCVLLDLQMNGMGGRQLQERLNERQITIPLVVVTGNGSVPTVVDMMSKGAVSLLQKPFQPQELLDTVKLALECDRQRRRVESARQDIKKRQDRLLPIERRVMELLTEGKQSKEISDELKIGFRTVQRHRANVMAKMEVESLAALVQLCVACQEESRQSPR
jgi:FixJ family two-component response regulator